MSNEIDELIDEVNILASNIIFSAFVQLGKDHIKFENDGSVTYDKTKHLTEFQILTESYDELAKQKAQEDEKEEEISEKEGTPA